MEGEAAGDAGEVDARCATSIILRHILDRQWSQYHDYASRNRDYVRRNCGLRRSRIPFVV